MKKLCTLFALLAYCVLSHAQGCFVSASKVDVLCKGQCTGSASVAGQVGVAPYTYSWMPGGYTTPNITGLCAANYTLTMITANGCTATTVKNIYEPLLGIAVSTNSITPTICSSCTGTATAQASGADPPFSYSWNTSPVQTTQTATGLCAGTYTVTVMNSKGCKKDKPVTITVVANSSLSASTNSTSSSCSACTGTSSIVSPSGGTGPYTYSWNTSPFQTTATATGLCGGTSYTCTISDTKGCTTSKTVSITQNPIPSAPAAGGNSPVCSGQTLSLTASIATAGAIYSWNGPNFYSSTSQNPIISPVTTAASGTYSVTVTMNGCSSPAATISITVNPKPTVSISANLGLTTICTGLNSTTLTATTAGGSSYSWSPGSHPNNSTIVVYPQSSITYSVVVTDTSNNCKGIDSIYIKVNLNPYSPPLVTPLSPSYCVGDSILPITATANPTTAGIAWFNSAYVLVGTNAVYQPLQSLSQIAGTTYYYVVQGFLGCFSLPSQVPVTINPRPRVDAGSDITICPGFTAQLSASVSGNTTSGLDYQWFFNSWDSLIPNSNFANISVTPDSTAIFIVEVINGNDCWHKDTIKVVVNRDLSADCKNICDSIYNGITPNNDGFNDEWWINGISSFPENNVTIFNRWGTKVWFMEHYDNNNKDKMWKGTNEQKQGLPDGTYYYVIAINTEDGSKTCAGWVEVMR